MSEDGFLSRWSRRKTEARDGVPTAEIPAPAEPAPPPVPAAPQAADPAPAEPPPTLADVARLTRESDFTRFVAPGVDADVRNAALKKLFSDPQFNVMDGLDTYIDDYNKPDPLPLSMLRKMAQAQFLGLVTETPETPPDENADLRLQSDDAAGRAGPEPGADGDAGREP
jgi:hypothetical protein